METSAATPKVQTPSGHTLARGFSWIWSGTLVGQIAWFGSLIALGSLLPPSAFGSVAIGLFIANAAGLVQDAGSRGSIVLARQLHARDVVRAVSVNLGVGIAFAAVAWIAADAIVSRFDVGADPLVLRILMLSVAVRALAIAPMAVLQRTLHFRLQGTVVASSMLIAAVVSVVCGLAGVGVWALVVRQLAAAALLPLFAWFVAAKPIRAELAAPPRERGPVRRSGAVWFFLLAAADFVALSIDSVVVGHSGGALELGLYSLAFTLAFAPLTNFAWQIGKVVFPAAAQTADFALVSQRMLRTTRLTAVILVPLLPPTLVLAPVLLPALLGAEWKPMVVPFEILVAVGIGHAVLVALGDSLSGIGAIAWRARVHCCWSLGMAVALIVFVHAWGITGAALAHGVMFFPFAAAYVIRGTRFLETNPAAFLRSLTTVTAAAAVEVVATVVVLVLARQLLTPLPAALLAAGAGLAAVSYVILRRSPALRSELTAVSQTFAGRAPARP